MHPHPTSPSQGEEQNGVWRNIQPDAQVGSSPYEGEVRWG